jgi:D-alanine-D-alanine ligase
VFQPENNWSTGNSGWIIMKEKIGIIFGGRSVEHEVSIITGLQVFENIDKNRYDVVLIYIDKKGNWYSGKELENIRIYSDWQKNQKKVRQFYPGLDKKDKKNILNLISAAVIAGHGNDIEDGKIQGMLDLIGIPYTSSGTVGSAVGMDKVVMKKLFIGMNLPVLPYLWFYREDWLKDKKECINRVHYTLDYPVFIKPANLGSSIGISMAKNEEELIQAIEVAVSYDRRILIEKGVEKAVEVNCSALSRNQEVLVSALEEPVKWEEFLSFQDKYIRSNSKTKSSGMNSMTRKIPAQIPDDIKSHIEEYTRKIYRAMDCKGVVRIDYILSSDKTKLYVNEINTIPGSLSFYLWEPAGISFKELINIMISEARSIYESKKNDIVEYQSDILKKIGGAKGSKTGR